MHRFFPLFALILAAVAPSAPAAVDLFQARAPVADQSEPARAAALRQAFVTVLVRVTGDTHIEQAPGVSLLIENLNNYAQGSSYEQSGETLRLRATFDGAALTAALHTAGLPVWGANRPAHLLWIGLDGVTPAVVTRDNRDTLTGLLDAADARGVPLILPQGDAVDMDAVKPADIFVGGADAILTGSRRYDSDQIVSAWVSENNAHWSANWSQLSGKGVTRQWLSRGDSADAALAAGVRMLADVEAQQFAVRGVSTSIAETTLEVDGVQTLADYARTLNYLKKLDLAKNVGVVSVQGARVLFRLRVDGGETQLLRVIAAGSVLREAAATARGALGFTLVR